VAAFEDISAIQKAASFTAINVYRPGDTVCVLYIQVCRASQAGLMSAYWSTLRHMQAIACLERSKTSDTPYALLLT